MNGAFARSRSLLGDEAMERLAAAKAIVVGVGGVGSWAAEALVRTGVGEVAIMDDDTVAESNLNRQCPACADTLGMPKVEVMAARLRAINPECRITGIVRRYPEGGGDIDLSRYDVAVDAIDSIKCKARLILDAQAAGCAVVSSMGAAMRLDPTKVVAGRFDKVVGDHLAKALRRQFKLLGRHPKRFTAVWSTEQCAKPARAGEMGSVMSVTATFGMCIAAKAIEEMIKGK